MRRSPRSRKRSLSGLETPTIIGLATLLAVVQWGDFDVRTLTSAVENGRLAAAIALGALSAALFATALRPLLRPHWHHFANTHWVGAPTPIRNPIVVDGDTIRDGATGECFRIANIDAPEMGAGCFLERERAEAATREAYQIIRRACSVSARRTFRKDRYGRRVAFVLVDGVDWGEHMIDRGLAIDWRGRREKWCGLKGSLARIAANGGPPYNPCKYCRARGA